MQMRRWNGWGDNTTTYHLHPTGATFLLDAIGPASPPHDVTLADVVSQVPLSRLPAHPLVTDAPEVRVLHARGQSLPDWIALRSGRIGVFPDGVAFPTSDSDVRDLLRYAQSVGAHIIPYGGGTSVVGHINLLSDGVPTLTVDMSHMSRLNDLSQECGLATFGAGVSGPNLEAQLRALGYTLGHFPQSFERSTLGGWIAARSSGQQSLHYGRIERLFAGARVETPAGTLVLHDYPASAAGPDLREVVLGSEGRIGIITEATVGITRLPEREVFLGVFFPHFEQGMCAVRQIAQAGIPASMMRMSNAVETATTLVLTGRSRLLTAVERLLAARGVGDEKSLLIIGFTGQTNIVKTSIREALAMAHQFGGVSLGRLGRIFGEQWRKSRFRTPYLRNTLWEMGYAVETVETATPWINVRSAMTAIQAALRESLPKADLDERVHVFTHLSHVYPHGSSIYTTCLFRIAADPVETLERWRILKKAASEAIIEHGCTISHQHGIGLDHMPYLVAEKGLLAMDVLRQVCRTFDPAGMMNPGKLVENATIN